MAGFFSTMNRRMPQTIQYNVFGGYGTLCHLFNKFGKPIVERQCVHICYGPSKRLNFVQFILFKNSTNFDYQKLYTSRSLPILKNASCPLFFFYIQQTSVLLSLRKVRVLLPRLFSGSETFLRPWQKQYVNHFKFITLLEYKIGATRSITKYQFAVYLVHGVKFVGPT